MNFLESEKYSWEIWQDKEITCHYKGQRDLTDKIISYLNSSDFIMSSMAGQIKKILANMDDFTSAVIDHPEFTISWVDHIRSWPLYYTQNGEAFVVSPDAHLIKDTARLNNIDDISALEFAMSGYVTGKETLYHDLQSLEPGTFLIWNKKSGALLSERYFRYTPVLTQSTGWEENTQNISRIFDNLTRKIIARADGKTIWVPLSAGLDSRILLCKLHEHGYPHIETFTYGPRGNFEAKYAKRIARRLQLPWRMIILSNKELRACFESQTRQAFWRYADGLKTIPCMREYSAIHALHQSGDVKEGDIFLNGQSGDYITGGHIAQHYCKDGETDAPIFFQGLIDKHYDLWKGLKTKEHIGIIKNKISTLCGAPLLARKTNQEWAVWSEMWEYDGRQISYVVNGQRVYEFFGYTWEMPLWEKEMVDFCESLPLEQKEGQALYKAYLRDYNYAGLFPEKEPYIWRWPITMLWVIPVARIWGLCAGKKAKDDFYALMRYYAHYANQYKFFPWSRHKNTYKDARNIVSLHVQQWIMEHQNQLKPEINDALRISKATFTSNLNYKDCFIRSFIVYNFNISKLEIASFIRP